MEICFFVAALQRFQVGQNPIIYCNLAVFAHQPRWRHNPWNSLFFKSKNRTFVSFIVYKDNVEHATEVQEIQPADIIFPRQM